MTHIKTYFICDKCKAEVDRGYKVKVKEGEGCNEVRLCPDCYKKYAEGKEDG